MISDFIENHKLFVSIVALGLRGTYIFVNLRICGYSVIPDASKILHVEKSMGNYFIFLSVRSMSFGY